MTHTADLSIEQSATAAGHDPADILRGFVRLDGDTLWHVLQSAKPHLTHCGLAVCMGCHPTEGDLLAPEGVCADCLGALRRIGQKLYGQKHAGALYSDNLQRRPRSRDQWGAYVYFDEEEAVRRVTQDERNEDETSMAMATEDVAGVGEAGDRRESHLCGDAASDCSAVEAAARLCAAPAWRERQCLNSASCAISETAPAYTCHSGAATRRRYTLRG